MVRSNNGRSRSVARTNDAQTLRRWLRHIVETKSSTPTTKRVTESIVRLLNRAQATFQMVDASRESLLFSLEFPSVINPGVEATPDVTKKEAADLTKLSPDTVELSTRSPSRSLIDLLHHAGHSTTASHQLEETNDNHRANHFVRDGPAPLIDSTGERRWIVESILGHEDRVPYHAPKKNVATRRGNQKNQRAKKTVRYYLVHWLGYPHDSDTWELGSNLVADVPGLVQRYEDQLHQQYAQRA
ncbi:TPA: hypothetical protein N0F65_011089 [Lagenidium giganteum]|uniref:Chromo domain-containing protein n=1 Tax=Lagenidium giganteum TaxID=4803 RepID=A0AAV2ZAT4_9STRA|nr:TPA: hypothetical protein N0F65_011089 [Lagenidium giganteum]